MMAWSSGDGSQQSDAHSMDTGPSSPPGVATGESGGAQVVVSTTPATATSYEADEEEIEEAVDVLAGAQPGTGHEIVIGDFDDVDDVDDEEDEDDDESSFRVSSIDEACASKTESSCPSSAGSLGLDPLGLNMRRSLSPRHHPLLSPMHMSKTGGGSSGGLVRQVSPARSDVGVSPSSRAGCKRSVSSAINGKELLSLPPSHSLPVSPLLQRKFFGGRSPQRSYSHSRMTVGRSLTRLSGSGGIAAGGSGHAVVTISTPDAAPGEDDDEQRRRMRDILQNLPLAEIYKKRARRNNSRERGGGCGNFGTLAQGGGSSGCGSSVPSFSDSTPACESASSAGAQSTMEVFIHTPSQQETPPLSASSGRHNFKKALRDRYLLSQSYRAGGGGGGGSSGGGSSSSQDSGASGGRLPLDLTSERFTKIREPLKSETEDYLTSPHLMLTDDTNPNSPMDPPSITAVPPATNIPSIMHHPPPQSLSSNQGIAPSTVRHPLHLASTAGSMGSMGDDDAFYPTTPAPPSVGAGSNNSSAVTAAAVAAAAVACNIDPVQLIARTCRIESSSSSYLSVDMDSDPFSPMSPMSPCLISPKHQAVVVSTTAATAPSHHLTPPGAGTGAMSVAGAVPSSSHHHLQPASAATSGHWIQPPCIQSMGVHRGGPAFVGSTPTNCGGAMHPGAIPIQRQCQSAPQTPHSSPQIRPQFFFPPHSSHMPPPAAAGLSAGVGPLPPTTAAVAVAGGIPTVSSALSSPGLSPAGSLSSPQSLGGDGSPGAAVTSTAAGGLSPRVTHGCPVCGRSFSRSDMLSRHMRLHTGLKPYECSSCGQSFSRSDHLNTHIRTHTGEKPYHCPQCSYSACRRDMITRHMKVHRRKLTSTGSGASASPPPPHGTGGASGNVTTSPRIGTTDVSNLIGGSNYSISGEGSIASHPMDQPSPNQPG